VTDEKLDIVDKWFATKKKTGYPIVILDGTLEKTLGVPHFPFAGVIGPDGNLAYAGDSPEAALKKAMKDAKAGSMWPKKLVSAATLLRNYKLADAWADLQALKTAGGLDAVEQKIHERFTSYVSEVTDATVKQADELFKGDMIYAAQQKVEPIATAKTALPATEAAQKLLAELKAVPSYDLEIKGGVSFASAVALEESEAYSDAVMAFKDITKKAAGTKIAGVAQRRAQTLIDKGMPGYAPACEKCQKLKKACEKHAKPIKA
jgi:hypothetical protein